MTIGGVALNCVGDGRILREGLFEKIWVQPAAGDAGGAIGAALLAWHHYEDKPRSVTGERDAQRGSFLGPTFDAREFLRSRRIANVELTDEELPLRVAALLAEGKVVGCTKAGWNSVLHSRCDACRLFRTHANGEPRRKSAFLFFTARVRGADLLRSAGQHFFQRAGRTTGLHAGRSVPVFHAHGHAFTWKLSSR